MLNPPRPLTLQESRQISFFRIGLDLGARSLLDALRESSQFLSVTKRAVIKQLICETLANNSRHLGSMEIDFQWAPQVSATESDLDAPWKTVDRGDGLRRPKEGISKVKGGKPPRKKP